MTVRPAVMLRQATANDAPKIAEIWHLGWRDGHLGFVPEELVAARHEDSFRIRAAQRVSDTAVAVINGEVAGFMMVVGDEVEQVYVAARRGWSDAGPFNYAAAGEDGPISVPSRRYVKHLS